jgi:DNA polymerase-3 subunit gamma/tau
MSDTTETGSPSLGRPYRVLARKYRPENFDALIGQEPMVRTLRNAFETGRIAQAWMLTGVRGVGKTTTARILARALNYAIPGRVDAPTIDMKERGIHCDAILESRHVDVIEMDAASHTGIDDIRDLTDAARYRPASARYKVYIIDEVHMLSKAAFNGLLKTLEEPPSHVKFVFATTEIRKVPVTVLSRCQRFDLRRVPHDVLVPYLGGIAEKESVSAEADALAAIARASEGSVRDSLSLLDRAIAHGAGAVRAADVAAMLGVADRAQAIDLFETVMGGRIAEALELLSTLYEAGADPAQVIGDLAAFCHLVTRLKLVPEAAGDPGLSEAERTRGLALAERLSVRALSRAWQVLLAGVKEVESAPHALAAADMVLVRLAHLADLPTPDELVRMIGEGRRDEPAPASRPRAPSPAPRVEASAPAQPRLDRFVDVVALVREKRDLALAIALERQVRCVSFQRGRIELAPLADAPPTVATDLAARLRAWTGERWLVIVASGEVAGETIHEERERARGRLLADVSEAPEVKAILERFPGAEIVDVRLLEPIADVAEDVTEEGDESEPPLTSEAK